jgi:hypothetical protein
MSPDPRRSHIALYDGAYGLTLRIEAPTRFLVERFVRCLALLAERRVHHVDLVAAMDACTTDIAMVELCLDERSERIGVNEVGGTASRRRLTWTNTPAGWESCVEFLKPFRESFEPGHVYLTSESRHDVLVEFTYGEQSR